MTRAWKKIALGDILTAVQYGTSAKASTNKVGVPVLRMGNIQDGTVTTEDLKFIALPPNEVDRYRLAPGDILINRTNSAELVGKSGVFGCKGDYVFASYLIRLRVDVAVADPSFVNYAINFGSGQDFLKGQSKAAIGQSNINAPQIRRMPLSLPPLAEQRRLVARIEALTTRLEQARDANQASLAETEHILTIARRTEYERLLLEEDTIPLAEVGRILSGGTPSKAVAAFWNGDIPWIAPKEMKRFRLGESSMNVTRRAVDEGAAKLVPEPAVLMVVRGMILAKRVPIAVSTRPLTINQDMKAFVPRADIDVTFLGHMLCGAAEELQTRVEVAGHGTCKLETSAWAPLPIPVSKPREQRRIVEHLDALTAKQDELRRLQTETEAELSAFTPALLAKAFRGEL